MMMKQAGPCANKKSASTREWRMTNFTTDSEICTYDTRKGGSDKGLSQISAHALCTYVSKFKLCLLAFDNLTITILGIDASFVRLSSTCSQLFHRFSFFFSFIFVLFIDLIRHYHIQPPHESIFCLLFFRTIARFIVKFEHVTNHLEHFSFVSCTISSSTNQLS